MPTVKQQPRDADRLSAYSDAVFAVIVTIMVLQLRAPHSPRLSALITLWQPAVSYLVSYVFIAIIWINHHYLSRLTRATTLPIIWINFVHLFFVSLLPFTTAWIAQTRLTATPVVMYAALFVCADGTYNVFERRVLRESDEVTDQQRRMARYRSLVAFALFTSAAVLAGFVPWAGFGLICLALVLHLKPDIGVRRRRRYYRERCRQGSCAARARQSRPADRADGPAMRLSRRVDPAHLNVQSVLNSYTCCRSPSRSEMTGPNSARSPGSEGKETMTQNVARRSALATLGSGTRPAPRRGMVLAAATLGFGVINLDVSVVNVAVKPIGTALGGGVSGVQWVVDAYTLVFAALILSAGALGDRSGHKRLLMAGFAVFTLASAACGLVPAIGELIAARAVQGAGAAALGASSLSLINHTYPDAAGRARAVSVWTAGGAATLAAGPLIGGLLIAAVGWRSIFFINLPLGALGWWLTRRYATTTPADPGRGTDLPGQVTAIIALTALAGSTIEAGSAGSRLPLVYGGYALAAAAGAAFIAIEHARERPMLPLSLFRMRAFSTAACAGLLVNLVFFGLIFAFSLFLQRQQGLSPLATGLAFLPVTVLIVVSNLVAGRILPARGTRAVAWAGALLMGAGCLAMLGLLAARADPLVPALIAGLSLTGFGIGLVVTAITAALLGSVAPAQSGIASGTFTAFRQTGSVLGVALFGTLLAGLHPSTGLEVTFAIGAGLVAVVAALGHAAA